MNRKLPSPLRGIIPPMITPLLEKNILDRKGLECLIEHMIAGGIHGLFILGSSGEGPSLSYNLRRELIQETYRIVKERIPVIVGITDTSFVESVNIAKVAADVGCDAVVIAPPYYFHAGQEELIEYIRHLIFELPLPFFLYNMPSLTKLTFDPDSIKRIVEFENVIGLKDSSGNMIYFHQLQYILKARRDFSLLIGPEELLAETILLGGHGGICGGANLFPSLYVKLYEAAVADDLFLTRKLHEAVINVANSLYNVGKYKSSYLKGIKCMLKEMGICEDFLAEPFHCFRGPERQIIQNNFTRLRTEIKDLL